MTARMRRQTFDAVDEQTIIALLTKLRVSGRSIPDMPQEVFYALRGIVALTAVEVLVVDDRNRVLLTWRDDEHWRGWHLPGGFVAPFEPLAAACSRIAQRELMADVQFERVIDAASWADHPYASVVSIVCRCRASGPLRVGEFFDAAPDSLIEQHRPFLAAFFNSASSPTDG